MTLNEIKRRIRRRFWSLRVCSRPADLRDLLTVQEALALARRGLVPSWSWIGRQSAKKKLARKVREIGAALAAVQETLTDG